MNKQEKKALIEKLEAEKKIYIRFEARGLFGWLVYGDFEDQYGEAPTMDDAYAEIYDVLVQIGVLG